MKYIEVAGLNLCDNDLVMISTHDNEITKYKYNITQMVYLYKQDELFDKNNNMLDLSIYGILPPYYVVKISERDKKKMGDKLFEISPYRKTGRWSNYDILGHTIKPGDICVSLYGGKFNTLPFNWFYPFGEMTNDCEYLVMYSKAHFLYITNTGVTEVTTKDSVYNLNYIKLSEVSDELKGQLKSCIDSVLSDVTKSAANKEKMKNINTPGTVYQGNIDGIVYLYLGKYKLDVDTSNYNNCISLGSEYLLGGEMYIEINTNRNPGKTLYEKLINGTLSASEFDNFIVKSGINLGLDYYSGYNTVDDYIYSGDFCIIKDPLNLKCIKFNLTNRKFKSVIGKVYVPTSLSFNLKGRRSYKDVVYQMIPL